MKMKVIDVSILCLLCVFSPLCATTITDGRDFSSPHCKTLMCEQAHEQAKGLSKLAILDEFVSQTVFLLKSLMKNIDGELEKSASSLLRYIHPYCNSTRDILNEVIQKQQEKLVRASPALSEDIDPMSEEETDRSHGNEYGGKHYDTYGGDRESQEVDRPEDSSDSFDDGSYYSGSGDAGGSHKTRGNSKFGNSGVDDHSWGISSTRSQEKEDDQWVGSESSGHGTRDHDYGSGNFGQQESQEFDWKPSGNKHGRPSSGTGKHLHGTGRGHGSHQHGQHHTQHCKGVKKGSAFWVPGLDQWCVDNCNRGYCPRTHCIC